MTPPEDLEAPIEQGTSIIVVRDTLLAAAMISIGIPLRKDPAYVHVKLANGQQQWSFNFHSADREGHVTAKDCIEAWQQDVKWIKANPLHPFAFAMTAVKNFARLREHQEASTPFHVYELPPDEETGHTPKLLVMAGSAKERAAIAKNYRRL